MLLLTAGWRRSQVWAIRPEAYASLAEAVAAGGLLAAPSPRGSRGFDGVVVVVPALPGRPARAQASASAERDLYATLAGLPTEASASAEIAAFARRAGLS